MTDDRRRLVDELRARLLRRGLPRLEMVVIVLGTGVVGFYASAGLLALGVSTMALRYPLAPLAAYGTFLLIVRMWAEYHRRGVDIDLLDGLDLVGDIVGHAPDGTGEGGDFSGGGSSGAWEGPGTPVADAPSEGGVAGGGGAGDLLDVDLDDAWIVVVPVVLLLGSAIAAFFVIWSAPVLLAELVLDVLLVSGLYRRLKHLERRSWLRTAVRKTWVPALLLMVILAGAGLLVEALVPGADSIGDAFGV